MNENQGQSLESILRVIKRKKLTILGLWIVIAASLFLAQRSTTEPTEAPKSFQSSVQVMVTPPPASSDDSSTNLRQWFASEQLLRKLVLSKDVLESVASKVEFDGEWSELKDTIELAPIDQGQEWAGLEDSFVIQLSVDGSDPRKTQQVAEVLVEELIEYTRNLAAREVVASRRLLEEMLLENTEKLETAQTGIHNWRKQNDVWNGGELTEAQADKIADLQEKREETLVTLNSLQNELEEIQGYLEGYGPEPTSTDLPTPHELEVQLEAEMSKLQRLSKIFNDGNEQLIEQQIVVQEAKAALKQARKSSAGQIIRRLKAGIRVQSATIAGLDRQIHQLKNDDKVAESQVKLESLQRDIQSLEGTREDLQEKLDEVRLLEEKRRNLGAFIVIEEPAMGRQIGGGGRVLVQASDKKKLAYSLFFSLAASLMIVLTYNSAFNSRRLRVKIEETLSQPVVGLIPKLRKSSAKRWSNAQGDLADHVSVVNDPNSPMAEQFRTLVVNIMANDRPKKILVTSSWPGEGKSFVCANLAATITKFGEDVLLVDADLRRPHLTAALDAQTALGARQCLLGDLHPTEATLTTSVARLTFLPAGTGSENAAELFAKSDCLSKLLSADENKTIVVDSPPLSACSDPLQLGKLVDGVLLVVNSRNWDGEAESEYLEDLLDHDVPILGIIINSASDEEISLGYKGRYQKYYTPS